MKLNLPFFFHGFVAAIMVIEASLTVFLGILHELDYTDQETPRLFYTPVDTILDPGELLHLLPS